MWYADDRWIQRYIQENYQNVLKLVIKFNNVKRFFKLVVFLGMTANVWDYVMNILQKFIRIWKKQEESISIWEIYHNKLHKNYIFLYVKHVPSEIKTQSYLKNICTNMIKYKFIHFVVFVLIFNNLFVSYCWYKMLYQF